MRLNVSLVTIRNWEQSKRCPTVAAGLYGSASEVIREALRLFEAYHLAQQAHLNALKADIDRGIADMKAGRVAPVDMADIKLQGRRLRDAR